MTQDIQPRTARPGPAAQFVAPPSARELRAQAVHRLQVGFLGLCAMLLLVGLANIIMDRARLDEAGRDTEAAVTGKPGAASDPLADIGVVPAAAPSASPARREPGK